MYLCMRICGCGWVCVQWLIFQFSATVSPLPEYDHCPLQIAVLLTKDSPSMSSLARSSWRRGGRRSPQELRTPSGLSEVTCGLSKVCRGKGTAPCGVAGCEYSSADGEERSAREKKKSSGEIRDGRPFVFVHRNEQRRRSVAEEEHRRSEFPFGALPSPGADLLPLLPPTAPGRGDGLPIVVGLPGRRSSSASTRREAGLCRRTCAEPHPSRWSGSGSVRRRRTNEIDRLRSPSVVPRADA